MSNFFKAVNGPVVICYVATIMFGLCAFAVHDLHTAAGEAYRRKGEIVEGVLLFAMFVTTFRGVAEHYVNYCDLAKRHYF